MTTFVPIDNAEQATSDTCGNCGEQFDDHTEADIHGALECPSQLPTYTEAEAIRFVADMREAGLPVEHYHGRSFWKGPAVRVDNLQTALSSTKVPCQWDNMGMGWIVYPMQSDAGYDGGPFTDEGQVA